MYFNNKDRKTNIFKASIVSTICSVLNICMGFLYRTVFLFFLSAEYLGINGLFTNVLSLLSLGELGITSAITFRFYQPIKDENIEKVGELMNFFKSVYRIILLAMLGVGLAMLPLINHLVADPSEVPPEVNLRFIYILFLLQTTSTYMFSYKQTMLTVDQNQHVFSACQTIINLIKYGSQIVVLYLFQNYTLSLALGITATVTSNFVVSAWVAVKYKEVFKITRNLPIEEKRAIYNDTKASMCHKIGGTVLSSTDNIILTKFVSLTIVGIYSNYSLISSSLIAVLNQLFCSFTASIGNAYVDLSRRKFYVMYLRMINFNFWVVGVITSLLYLLIDDFICIWLGNAYLLDSSTVAVLAVQLYIEMIRLISNSFVSATGLFVKDKIRPLIEASLNVVISIVAVKLIGIQGVFLGTIISHILTVTWREPYLLYKYVFNKGVNIYWKLLFVYIVSTLCFVLGFKILFHYVRFDLNVLGTIVKGLTIFLSYLILTALFCWKKSTFKYYYRMIKERLTKNVKS